MHSNTSGLYLDESTGRVEPKGAAMQDSISSHYCNSLSLRESCPFSLLLLELPCCYFSSSCCYCRYDDYNDYDYDDDDDDYYYSDDDDYYHYY